MERKEGRSREERLDVNGRIIRGRIKILSLILISGMGIG